MLDKTPPCFSQTNAVPPTFEKVRPNLSNGEAGRRIAEAVFAGDLAAVERMVQADRRLLQTRAVRLEGAPHRAGAQGDLLSFAIGSCNPEMVGLLLELGANPNGLFDGEALSLALLANDLVMAEMLFQAGAAPDGPNRSGLPVYDQLMFAKHDGLLLALRRGADPNLAEEFGSTPLDTALGIGDWQAARILMENGANPWQAANKGTLPATLLHTQRAPDAASEAIRRELAEKARRPGLPWPPPSVRETQDKIHSGEWPTPEMERAGFVVTPQARRSVALTMSNRNPQPPAPAN